MSCQRQQQRQALGATKTHGQLLHVRHVPTCRLWDCACPIPATSRPHPPTADHPRQQHPQLGICKCLQRKRLYIPVCTHVCVSIFSTCCEHFSFLPQATPKNHNVLNIFPSFNTKGIPECLKTVSGPHPLKTRISHFRAYNPHPKCKKISGVKQRCGLYARCFLRCSCMHGNAHSAARPHSSNSD